MTPIQAIEILEAAFNANKEYKKTWQDYIELVITEEMEEMNFSDKDIIAIRGPIAKHILRLFDTDWWKAQQ
jgi:predicted metalloenzyme YecM